MKAVTFFGLLLSDCFSIGVKYCENMNVELSDFTLTKAFQKKKIKTQSSLETKIGSENIRS